MKVLVSASVLVLLVAVASSQADKASPANQQQLEHRQGRSMAGNSQNSINSLSSTNGNSNTIDHTSSKSRFEQEKRQVQEFLTTKNIVKQIIKLLFGTQDEVNATSRTVLSVLTKMLDLLKNTFGQKSRSGTARTLRDSAEDAAVAGASVLQGYVKSVLASDNPSCVKRYLCQASKEAVRDSKDLGFVIASVGGYAASYLLDDSSHSNFKYYNDASAKGRMSSEDCTKLFSDCQQ